MTKKEFTKEFRSELKMLRQWERDMRIVFLKLPDSEYKFKQLNNAIQAIYTAYCRMERLSSNYKP
jgi:hypothetical protein